jgi:hypothetical protein
VDPVPDPLPELIFQSTIQKSCNDHATNIRNIWIMKRTVDIPKVQGENCKYSQGSRREL